MNKNEILVDKPSIYVYNVGNEPRQVAGTVPVTCHGSHVKPRLASDF